MNRAPISLGCDPEIFIKRKGVVIGSEKVIKDGQIYTSVGSSNKVIVDGVQAELNPSANPCRQSLNYNIQACLRALRDSLGKDDEIDFSQIEKVTREELLTLSQKAQTFGCKPSFNIDETVPKIMELDPMEYLYRSTGGHIHLGASGSPSLLKILQTPEQIVPVLDVIVGNTFVLLDRHEGNIERRKHYGRAGEYRLPTYGIEYRTLSNFWLRSDILASLAFGLARQAVAMVYNGLDKELMALVDYEDIVTAINKNDYDLALKNFDKVKTFICDSVGSEVGMGHFPLDNTSLKGFEKLIKEGVVDKHFPQDNKKILATWMGSINYYGAWQYLNGIV